MGEYIKNISFLNKMILFVRTTSFIISMAVLSLPIFASAQEVVRKIIFPVNGENHFSDSFGDPRSDGREHLGTDIIADKHTPLLSAVDGRVTFMPTYEPSWGYAIYINDEEDYSYRYLHINNDTPGTDDNQGGLKYAFAPGLSRGSEVKAGQLIGWVGDSGNAESVGAHLHFEIWTPDIGSSGREPINSYPSLIAATKPLTKSVYHFSKDLELGDRDADVLQLQKYLNLRGFTVATSGAGSPGNETDYFGPATQTALVNFQKEYNIVPASGYFGLVTRDLVNNGNLSEIGSDSTLQPGWLVKNNEFAEVFYVDHDSKLRWIVDEEAAEKHFGSIWNQIIKEYEDLNVFGLQFGESLK